MDLVAMGISGALLLILLIGLTLWCLKRYEVGVFLMAMSPWVTTIFSPAFHEGEGELEVGLGSYIRISLLVWLGLVGLVRFFSFRRKAATKVPAHLMLMGVYLAIGMMSTLYSIDPRFTIIRSVGAVAVFGFLLGLNSWLESDGTVDRVADTLFLLVCVGTVASVASLFLAPDRAWLLGGNRFQGLTGHPNVMGGFCMLSYPVILWRFGKAGISQRVLLLTLGIVVLYLHWLTASRGSMLAAVVGTCVWLLVLRKWVGLVAFVTAMAICGALVVQLNPSRLDREENEDVTGLTGRPDFCMGCYQLIMERPLLGYGFGVEGKVWDDPRFNKSVQAGGGLWSGSAKASLHNGYLSVAIGSGITGWVLWCAAWLLPLCWCATGARSHNSALVLTTMSMLLVWNFVETEVTGPGGGTQTVFWLMWVAAGTLRRGGNDAWSRANQSVWAEARAT